MNGTDPSIQVDDSESSHGDDDDENHDPSASRQNEYDDCNGECLQQDERSYFYQNENDTYVSHSQTRGQQWKSLVVPRR
jgi:hypothetical protein